MRRSDSGAAVRLTRGRELGRALGCAVLRARKPVAAFAPRYAELLVVPLRFAEPRSSPPPHAAGCNSTGFVAFTAGGELRLRTNSAPRMNELSFCGSSNRRACGGASSMPGPDAAARTPKNWGGNRLLLLRPFRVARAGRLPTGGPQHAAPRRELLSLPGVRPTSYKSE